MANPQQYTYDAAGIRTLHAKEEIADRVTRVSVEETPLLSRLPRRKVMDIHVKRPEDDLSAIDTGNAFAEGSDAPAAASAARTTNENYCQLFKKTATVSDTQNAIAQYGVRPNEFQYQLGMRALEIKRDVEAIIISDQAVQAPTPANGRVAKMKGISTFITTNVDAVADFNQVNFEVLVRDTVVTYGGNPTEVWMDATRKNAVASWTEQVTRYQQDRPGTILNNVQVFESNIGQTFKLHLHPHLPQNVAGTSAVAFALDMVQANWEITELLPMQTAQLPYTGGGDSAQIQWQLCILTGAEKANFEFAG